MRQTLLWWKKPQKVNYPLLAAMEEKPGVSMPAHSINWINVLELALCFMGSARAVRRHGPLSKVFQAP